MLEELVKASFNLASRRIGALVALEREADLGEYMEAASEVDAVVSHPLLLSIFHHTSPMHDGAVVIQDGRLAAAGSPIEIGQQFHTGEQARASLKWTSGHDLRMDHDTRIRICVKCLNKRNLGDADDVLLASWSGEAGCCPRPSCWKRERCRSM